jgi:hypothetical protein
MSNDDWFDRPPTYRLTATDLGIDLSAPKGRWADLGFVRIWYTLASDNFGFYWGAGFPDAAGGRANCDVWFSDY